MPTALEEQIDKLSPGGPGAKLYQRVAGEQQAATLAATVGAAPGVDPFSVSGIDQQNAIAAAKQAKIEAEHSRLATIGAQAARGALDFVLAPAALLSAGLEGTGSLTGWDGLRDFGRELGQSAQGSEAMATLFNGSGVEAVKSVFGAGDAEAADTAYNRAKRDIAEQQQAWPMLSTVSHLAGAVGTGLGIGGMAGAVEGVAAPATTALSRIGGAAAMGGYEGAASGAEAAYGENRPLRDVLGSTIMGGLMGAATAGVFQGAAEGFQSKAFSDYLKGFAKERTAKAVGVIGSDVKNLGGKEEALRLADDVAKHVLEDGEGVFPKSLLKAGTISQDTVAERIALGKAELGEKLGDMRRSVSEYIDANAPELRPSVPELIAKIKTEALDELEESPILASRGGDIKKVLEELESKTVSNVKVPGPRGSIVETTAGKDISVNELRKIQENLKAKLYTKVIGAVPEAKAELQKVERIIEDAIEGAVDKAVPKMGTAEAGAYRQLRRMNRSFIQADDIAQRAVSRQLGYRGASLTDTIAGTAALAGDIASGGTGVVSLLKGMGATAAHKFAREHGSAFLAALANKLAEHSDAIGGRLAAITGKANEVSMDSESEWLGINAHNAALASSAAIAGGLLGGGAMDHQLVSVDAAGGREAQTVIATLERARREVAARVESAGDNPTQRQLAQQAALATISAQLAGKAGPYDPKLWADKMPAPLQKVLLRGPILDQVSSDLARDAAHAASLKPSPDFELNPDRVKKLTKDANGPTAIGGVQQAVRDIIRNAPATPTGDQIRLAARSAIQQLNVSDVPDAMTTGHNLARVLSGMAEGAGDQVTKDYIARQVTVLAGQLSDPSFGKAGALYGRLTGAPDTGFQQLMDPAALRASLSKANSTGELPAALKQFARTVIDAHDAKKQLSGEGSDKSVARALKAIETRFAQAEHAVTLDGGPAGRVLDFFSDKPGADAAGLRGAPELTVLNAIRPQMERLLPLLGKQSDRYTGEAPRQSVSPLPKSGAELQSLYSERMQTLAQNVNAPDPDSIAQSLRGLPNVPPAVQTAVATDAQQRMAQLLQDMPKPTSNIRGKAFETLSTDDLRRANAMWEATVKPLSVFADFHAGTLDYDKASYVWKQYPGIQQAAQAGLMDALHSHLDDSERSNIPDTILTQLDYLLGFNGTLQTSVDRGFASRMTAIAQAEAQKKPPQQSAQLEIETSKPTFTERLAQGRRG